MILSQLNASIIRFGTSSFSSKDWVGPFYPPRLAASEFLRFYSTRYDTVEIDATYYAVPAPKTVLGWRDKTPSSFLIAAKFPREIVHAGAGRDPDPEGVLDPDRTYPVRDAFLEVMRSLGPRLGPLVLQFPFFGPQAPLSPDTFRLRLDRFLSDLPPDISVAVEIRNREWLDASFADLCRRHRASLVLVDHAWMPHGDEVERLFDPVTADFAYVRLLGDREIIESVTETWDKEVLDRRERLHRWGRLLDRLLAREVPTLVYANNHYAGHAPATVERLREAFLKAGQERRDRHSLARTPVASPEL